MWFVTLSSLLCFSVHYMLGKLIDHVEMLAFVCCCVSSFFWGGWAFVFLFFLCPFICALPLTSVSCAFAGEDERPQSEQCGRGFLHPGRWTWFGHAGGLD